MHILESARTRFTCIPFVHEHSAVVAGEYFNHLAEGEVGRAFVLVTAGPGLTNSLTGIAGAWLESRELLVIGGQVKSSDLATGGLRQRGHQEVDGLQLVGSITKTAQRLTSPLAGHEIANFVGLGSKGRRGPVFIEFCLDVQAATADFEVFQSDNVGSTLLERSALSNEDLLRVQELIHTAERPVFLIGSGLDRNRFRDAFTLLEQIGIPVMTSWNASDYVDARSAIYVGRPNIWGQRSANVLIQQADLVLSLGARLGLQQTGFNWKAFAANAKIIQVDIDENELAKGHPVAHFSVNCDATEFLEALLGSWKSERNWGRWLGFCRQVRQVLPNVEDVNVTSPPFVSPFALGEWFNERLAPDDIVIPSSSGSSFTTMLQVFEPRGDQRMISNKGLASMGYGLAGAIGSAIQSGRRVILAEGDGGFAQNLQELGSVSQLGIPVKIFLYSNDGFATIRGTQKTYFDGTWVGCDSGSGLGLPDWEQICGAYGIRYMRLYADNLNSQLVRDRMDSESPEFFEVMVDPQQVYLPKVGASIGPDGTITSDPLHLMKPALDPETAEVVFQFLEGEDE